MSGLDPNGGGALVVPGGGGATLSDATPAALGTAAAGVSTSASRADHVHAAPAAADITDASATGISLLTAANALAARTALGLLGFPTSITTPLAGLRVNAAGTAYEEFMAFSVDESWSRPSPVTAGGGVQYLSKRDGVIYTSSGIARVAGQEGTGWMVGLPTRLGGDAVGLMMPGGASGAKIVATGLDLSAFSLDNLTMAGLFYWVGPVYAADATCLSFFGGTLGYNATGINLYMRSSGGTTLSCHNGAHVNLVTGWNPAAGLHAFCVAPVLSGGVYKMRVSVDGLAPVDVAMGGSFGTPGTSDNIGFFTRTDSGDPLAGAGIDLMVWNSTLSNASMQAITTLPGTATYLLDESCGGNNAVAAAFRISAQRYDPALPAALNGRGLATPCAVSGTITRTIY